MATRTVLSPPVAERTTPILGVTFVDEAGVLISVLDSLVGTLYDVRSETIINSRENVDLLPFVTNGRLEWPTTELDNIMIKEKKGYDELHRLLLTWTWQSGAKVGKHEIDFSVTNLLKVP